MSFLSSLFRNKPRLGQKLGELCLEVRADRDFLVTFTDAVSHSFESPKTITRFDFSKDVLMLSFALTVLLERLGDKGRPAYAALMATYINSAPVPETLRLNDAILLSAERTMLDTLAMGPYILTNQAPPHDIGSTPVSTRFILEKTTEIRFPKFATTITEAIHSGMVDQGDAWESTTRQFLSCVMSRIDEDYVPFLSALLAQDFSVLRQLRMTSRSPSAPQNSGCDLKSRADRPPSIEAVAGRIWAQLQGMN